MPAEVGLGRIVLAAMCVRPLLQNLLQLATRAAGDQQIVIEQRDATEVHRAPATQREGQRAPLIHLRRLRRRKLRRLHGLGEVGRERESKHLSLAHMLIEDAVSVLDGAALPRPRDAKLRAHDKPLAVRCCRRHPHAIRREHRPAPKKLAVTQRVLD